MRRGRRWQGPRRRSPPEFSDPSANPSEQLPRRVFRAAERADEITRGQIRCEQRRDVLITRHRDRLLRLDYLDVAGDAGGEPNALLRELTRAQVARARPYHE